MKQFMEALNNIIFMASLLTVIFGGIYLTLWAVTR